MTGGPEDLNDDLIIEGLKATPSPGAANDGAQTTTRKASKPRFILTPFTKVKALDGDSYYCVRDILPRTGLVVVWGPPKCGKSFWTFDLLMHVALGWEYRGHRIRQGSVVYLCLEGAPGFRKRIEAFRRAKLARPEDPKDPPFFLMTSPLALTHDVKVLVADIRRQAGQDIPSIVCIDTLNRSFTGSESKDQDMTAYVRAADLIRDAFGCLVVIVHHSPHDAERPRGHSSLMGALDVQIAVHKDTGGNVIAELELAKDMEVGLVFVSRLEMVELGRDGDGDPVTSLVVREVEGAGAKTAAKPVRGRKTDDGEKVKRAVEDAYERLADAVEKTPGFNGQTVRKVPVEKIRDEVKSRGFLDCKDTGGLTGAARTLFYRAKTDLIASGRYIEATGLFWRLTE
jgi:AAA domain